MTPAHGADQPFSFCVLCGNEAVADAIANVLMFLPLGVAFASLSSRRWTVVAGAALFSTAVEMTQAYAIPGRDGALGDIVFNTVGAALGVLAVSTRRVWLDPPERQSRRLGLAASGGVLLMVWLTSFFSQLSLPNTNWFGQWTPQFGGTAFYDGHVLDVRSAGRMIPSQFLDDRGRERSDLLSGVPLVVTATASTPTQSFSTIFSIADERQRFMLMLGADREDLRLLIGRRAMDARLVDPMLRVPNALAGTRPGDTIVLEVRESERGVCVGKRPSIRCDLGPTAGAGWQMLLSVGPFWRYASFVNIGWLCLLLIPAGYWFRGRWPAYLAAALVVGPAPWAWGLMASPASEWLGALCGVWVGMILRRMVQRRSPRAAGE